MTKLVWSGTLKIAMIYKLGETCVEIRQTTHRNYKWRLITKKPGERPKQRWTDRVVYLDLGFLGTKNPEKAVNDRDARLVLCIFLEGG